MTPHEALQVAIGRGLVDSGRLHGKPGAIVERMPVDVRAALQQLTAADIRHPLYVIGNVTPAERREEDRRALQYAFDRRLRRSM